MRKSFNSPFKGLKGPFYKKGGGSPFAVSIGSGSVTSGAELTATITPDPSPATPTYQWTDDGVSIAGATSATYSPTIGTDSVADLSLIRCVVTIDGEPYTSNARTIVYAAPTFSAQPQITGILSIGQTLTLVEGTAGPNATLEIVTFTLAGVDKTGELVGLDWDTTGESAGEIALQVSATNSGGTTLSDIITANLLASVNPTVTSFSVTERAGGQKDLLNLTVNKNGSTDTHVLGIVTRNGGTQLTGAQIKAGTGTFLERVVIDPLPTTPNFDLTGFTATSNGDRDIDVAVWEKNNGGVSDSATDNAIGLNFTALAFVSAETSSANTVVVTFDKNSYGTEDASDWAFDIDGIAATITGVSISGTDATLTISETIASGEVLDALAYSGGDLVGEDGNSLAPFSGEGITNNLTVSYGTDFVMEIETTTSSETFTIPGANTGGAWDATIDWGDGGPTSAITAWNDADLTHTYASAGTYVIRVSGPQFRAIRFNNGGDRLKVRRVLQLGSVGWAGESFLWAFRGCANMTEFTAGTTNTSAVAHYGLMFGNCSNLASIDLTGMIIGASAQIQEMFSGCGSLTSIDLTPFAGTRTMNMNGMFFSCSGLTSLDLSPFALATITSMSGTFRNCSGLTSLDVSPLNTSSCNSFRETFWDCSSLTSLDLSSLDTSSATNMGFMLSGLGSISSINLTGFDTSSVIVINAMLQGTNPTTITGLDGFDISSITNMNNIALFATLPTSAYDALLIAWSAQTVTSGLTPNFGSTKYTSGGAAEAARSSLIADDLWAITDGGPV